jgi:hypothetical protein
MAVVRYPQTDADSIIGESIEAVCWHYREFGAGASRTQGRPTIWKSGLWLLNRAVGSAAAFAFAGILARTSMFLCDSGIGAFVAHGTIGGATAFALAGVLTGTGMFFDLRILRHHFSRILSLPVIRQSRHTDQACRGAPEQTR